MSPRHRGCRRRPCPRAARPGTRRSRGRRARRGTRLHCPGRRRRRCRPAARRATVVLSVAGLVGALVFTVRDAITVAVGRRLDRAAVVQAGPSSFGHSSSLSGTPSPSLSAGASTGQPSLLAGPAWLGHSSWLFGTPSPSESAGGGSHHRRRPRCRLEVVIVIGGVIIVIAGVVIAAVSSSSSASSSSSSSSSSSPASSVAVAVGCDVVVDGGTKFPCGKNGPSTIPPTLESRLKPNVCGTKSAAAASCAPGTACPPRRRCPAAWPDVDVDAVVGEDDKAGRDLDRRAVERRLDLENRAADGGHAGRRLDLVGVLWAPSG